MKTITTYRLKDVAKTSGVEQNEIMHFVQEEWIDPFDPDHLYFDEEDIERIRLISELFNMGVNDESVPIILHLIDQLNHLHHGMNQILKFH